MNFNEQVNFNKQIVSESMMMNLFPIIDNCNIHPKNLFNKINIFENKNGKTLYHLQSEFRRELNNYKGMYLLSINEHCISKMIIQTTLIIDIINKIKIEYSRIKSNKDLNNYYGSLANIKTKDIVGYLLNDLGIASNKYGFEIDKKEISNSFKG